MPLVSMTGFGRAEVPLGARRVVAEIRTVNHRYLELKVRLGREDGELELEIGRLIRARLERGSVTVSVREEMDEVDEPVEPAALIDEARARAWLAALEQLGKSLHLQAEPSLALLSSLPGVLRTRGVDTARAPFAETARRAVSAALETLVLARLREGEALGREIGERLSSLARLRDEVTRLAASEPTAHADRLRARVAALLEGRGGIVEPQRLAQEIALLAERLDVTEELVRLGAHLDEAKSLCSAKGPVGRKLDFLSQELHREINTIGSKAQSSEIAAKVIDMKAELERFREQVQNLE